VLRPSVDDDLDTADSIAASVVRVSLLNHEACNITLSRSLVVCVNDQVTSEAIFSGIP
jgi:hypothetical protein